MKKPLLFLLMILTLHSAFSQNLKTNESNTNTEQSLIHEIDTQNLVGQKIKFLSISDSISDHTNIRYNFKKKINKKRSEDDSSNLIFIDYPYLKGRIGTFEKKNEDFYVLKMDDNGELIYCNTLFISGSHGLSDEIGIISLLESAREKYISKIMYDTEMEECKIIGFDFAEDKVKYSRRLCPYNVFYIRGNDTLMKNVYITESYGKKGKNMYFDKKDRVFEKLFTFKNPRSQLTKSNVDSKFILNIDKVENTKTYIHKNFINSELGKDNSMHLIDYLNKSVFSEITIINNTPRMVLISNFYDKNWIFHSSVKINIQGVTKQTPKSEGLREILAQNFVLETNYYDIDIELLKWISENIDHEITIRFVGKDYYEDVILPINIKYGLKETFELYDILLKDNKN